MDRRTHEEAGDAVVAELNPGHHQPASSEMVQSGHPSSHTSPAAWSLVPCGCTPLEKRLDLDVKFPAEDKFFTSHYRSSHCINHPH